MPQIESEADRHNEPPVIAIGDEKRTAKARKDGVQKLEVLEQPHLILFFEIQPFLCIFDRCQTKKDISLRAPFFYILPHLLNLSIRYFPTIIFLPCQHNNKLFPRLTTRKASLPTSKGEEIIAECF
jgi:hypothetical protein